MNKGRTQIEQFGRSVRPGRRTAAVAVIAALMAAHLVGCASSGESVSRSAAGRVTLPMVEPGQYRAVFNAARDVLVDQRLMLDRVDAELGVITTRPIDAALAGPEDFFNRQLRVVRVEFRPVGVSAADSVGRPALDGVPLELDVRVLVYRVQEPGWRPSATSVLLGTRATDPELVRRGLHPASTSPLREDEAASRRIAAEIMRAAARR